MKTPNEIWLRNNDRKVFAVLSKKIFDTDIRFIPTDIAEAEKVELIADWIEEYKAEHEADKALIRELVEHCECYEFILSQEPLLRGHKRQVQLNESITRANNRLEEK